jgi:hypothetical protein
MTTPRNGEGGRDETHSEATQVRIGVARCFRSEAHRLIQRVPVHTDAVIRDDDLRLAISLLDANNDLGCVGIDGIVADIGYSLIVAIAKVAKGISETSRVWLIRRVEAHINTSSVDAARTNEL